MLDFLLIFFSFTFRIQFPGSYKTDVTATLHVCGEGLEKEDVGYKRGTPLPAYLESGCNILHKFLSNSGTTDPGPSWEKSRKGHIETK